MRGSEPDDKKSVNGYVMLQELGSGSYGKVRLCLHKESGEYMVSQFYPQVSVLDLDECIFFFASTGHEDHVEGNSAQKA